MLDLNIYHINMCAVDPVPTANDPLPSDQWFDPNRDHFDATNTQTWTQAICAHITAEVKDTRHFLRMQYLVFYYYE